MEYVILGFLILIIILIVISLTKHINESDIIERLGKLETSTIKEMGEFKNSLNDLLPQKLIPVIIELTGIDPDKKVHQITKEERNKLVYLLKNLVVDINGFMPIDIAIITCGGVDVKQVNPKTMESKVLHNLFLAGEVLDVDAYTGGFNLQIAFSTAVAAGKN